MKKKLLLLLIMLITASFLAAWTTETGDILFRGQVQFDGPVTSTDTISAEQLTTTDDLTVTDDAAIGGALSAGSIASGTADYAFATTTPNDTYSVAGIGVVFLDSSDFAGTIGGLTGGVEGQHLFFSVIDATETITLENAEGGTGQDMNFDGAADITLNVNEGVHLVCDGSDWWEINR